MEVYNYKITVKIKQVIYDSAFSFEQKLLRFGYLLLYVSRLFFFFKFDFNNNNEMLGIIFFFALANFTPIKFDRVIFEQMILSTVDYAIIALKITLIPNLFVKLENGFSLTFLVNLIGYLRNEDSEEQRFERVI